MPTPMSAYVEAAKRFGKIDPNDEKAIDQFYVDTFPSLSKKKQEQILAFLLAHEGPAGPAQRSEKTLVTAPAVSLAVVEAAHAAIVARFAGRFFSGRLPRSFQPVSPPPGRPASAHVGRRRADQWRA